MKSTNLISPGGRNLPAAHEASALALRQGPIGGRDDPWGVGTRGTQPSGGPSSLGLLRSQGRFFFQSSVELYMVEIKGVAGCIVLLYFQALLLIRKQDQRQY